MKQFEVAPNLELKTEPLLKSAFVIKKGAYEKLVCDFCAANLVADNPLNLGSITPVTLSCEATCSICQESI